MIRTDSDRFGLRRRRGPQPDLDDPNFAGARSHLTTRYLVTFASLLMLTVLLACIAIGAAGCPDRSSPAGRKWVRLARAKIPCVR